MGSLKEGLTPLTLEDKVCVAQPGGMETTFLLGGGNSGRHMDTPLEYCLGQRMMSSSESGSTS